MTGTFFPSASLPTNTGTTGTAAPSYPDPTGGVVPPTLPPASPAPVTGVNDVGGLAVAGSAGDDVIDAAAIAGYQPAAVDGLGNPVWNDLYGAEGNDQLLGGAGDDNIMGGLGDDIMAGGAGADWYFLAAGDGLDIIADFTPGEDDLVFLDDGSGLAAAAPTVSNSADGAIVSYGNGDAVLLYGVDAGLLGSDPFGAASGGMM